MGRCWGVLVGIVATSLAAACGGGGGGEGGPGSGTGDESGDGADDPDAGDDAADDDGAEPPPRAGGGEWCEPDVGETPLRRLTRAQYDHTVRDLLGLDLALGESFVADEKIATFDSNAIASVTQLGVEQYMDAAETVATTLVADVEALLPCDPASLGEDECAEALIADLGPRAYRRPLTTEQHDDLVNLYMTARAEGSYEDGLRVIVQALLQSPFFLYHLEEVPTDDDGQPRPLTQYEVASRLSYFLWESMPDQELFDAAADDALDTPEAIRAQAERMIADEKASATIAHFHRQWLDVEGLESMSKDETLFPEFTPELATAMAEEVGRFAEYVIRKDDGRLATMLGGAWYTIANADLAELYGVEAPAAEWDRIAVPEGQRAGLLTLPGVMAAHSHENQTSPVLRGLLVRENFLCQVPPPPPDNVNDTPPGLDPTLPTKERFAQHRDDPACSGCHDLIDPLGYGLEHFDAIGRYRTMDGNFAVDATGIVAGTLDEDVEYDGALELAAVLVDGEQGRQCVAKQWFRYALGRIESTEDACTQDEIYAQFADSDFDIRELMIAIAVSDSLRNLRPATAVEE
ncbi:MAG: DUF1592 domain-containing protein [Myxococcota bacterium]